MQTSLERPLAGQSKNLFNLIGEYTLGGFSARLLFNFFGDRISDVGANQAPDIIEEGRGSSTWCSSSGSASSTSGSTLENLTDTEYLFTQGTEDQRVYKLGRTYRSLVRLQRLLARPRSCTYEEIMTRSYSQTRSAAPGGRVRRSRRSSPCRRDQAPPVNVPGIDKPVIVVTGEVTGTETWTNNFYYVLRGAVFVRDGAHAEHPGRHDASSARPAASAR